MRLHTVADPIDVHTASMLFVGRNRTLLRALRACIAASLAVALLMLAPGPAQAQNDTSSRLAALEAAVAALKAALANETAARQAADTALAIALADERKYREAADNGIYVGLYTEIDARVNADFQATARLDALEFGLGAVVQGLRSEITAAVEGVGEALRLADDKLREDFTSADNQLRADIIPGLPDCMSFSDDFGGVKSVVFEGCNVHIRNGTGSTAGVANGFGNLIIGYNEADGLLLPGARVGSHNLVVGPLHTYTSWGGIVAGSTNGITAPYATVTAGYSNTATGPNASVSGGYSNTASGVGASVSGGANNTASAEGASVSGGISILAGDLWEWHAGAY